MIKSSSVPASLRQCHYYEDNPGGWFMKCPLRVDALGNFGDCYEEECSWWRDECIILEFADKQIPERPSPKLKANKLFTAGELASILNLKESRIYELAREKILPSVFIGRQIRFSGKAVEDFIEKGGKRLPGGWKRE
jgi:excisionase family DNA binding protein